MATAAPAEFSFLRLIENLFRSKLVILGLLLLPGLYTFWPLFNGDETVAADPLKYILHHLGFTASVLLALVLCLTPLRVLLPKVGPVLALNRHRRLIGVTVFVYVALHVIAHFVYEGGFGTFPTDLKKPFIITGLVASLILLALAATSFNWVIRKLGARNWKWIHRLVYLAAILVIYHQIYARKVFPTQVLWIFLPVLILELLRIFKENSKKRPALTPRTAI